MGVVFEENDPATGGVFVASLAPDGKAAQEGSLKPGDQLAAIDGEVGGERGCLREGGKENR